MSLDQVCIKLAWLKKVILEQYDFRDSTFSTFPLGTLGMWMMKLLGVAHVHHTK